MMVEIFLPVHPSLFGWVLQSYEVSFQEKDQINLWSLITLTVPQFNIKMRVGVDSLKSIFSLQYWVFREVEMGQRSCLRRVCQDEISVWSKSSAPLANLHILCYRWGLIKLSIKMWVSVCQCPLFENLVNCLAAYCLVNQHPIWNRTLRETDFEYSIWAETSSYEVVLHT